MKKSVADRWVKALLSGRYKQIQGTLQTPEGNCCLGVLCRILKTPKYIAGEGTKKRVAYGTKDDHNSGVLPAQVMKKAGMRTDEGDYKGEFSLVDLNDKANYSFKQIAAVIKKRYKEL